VALRRRHLLACRTPFRAPHRDRSRSRQAPLPTMGAPALVGGRRTRVRISHKRGVPLAAFLSLREAIEDNLRDGDSVAMEGFTHLIPYAAGHEVIRQGRKDLTLIRMTPDILYDQLIGMGAAR